MCVSVPPAGWERIAKLVIPHELSLCHSGGTCINQAGGYVCQCPPAWTGKLVSYSP